MSNRTADNTCTTCNMPFIHHIPITLNDGEKILCPGIYDPVTGKLITAPIIDRLFTLGWNEEDVYSSITDMLAVARTELLKL